MVTRLVSVSVLAATVILATAVSAPASCLASTPEEQTERAEVIFDGVALEGPTASGRQRFEVRRYVKGDGPDLAQVATGVTRRADGSGSVTSVSLDVARGDAWRMYGERIADDTVGSSSCAGSRRLARGELPAAAAPSEGSNRTETMLVAVVAAVAVIGAAAVLGRSRRRGRPESGRAGASTDDSS